MQAGVNRVKIWDPSPYRQQNMTFWPKSHPVRFPHVYTDHWTKMKARVPSHLASLAPAMVMEKGVSSMVTPSPEGQEESEQSSPVLKSIVTEVSHLKSHGKRAFSSYHSTPCGRMSPQNLPQYRNEYNDRARMGFRYWLIEKKVPKSFLTDLEIEVNHL